MSDNNASRYYPLPHAYCIEVAGKDATAIVNNLVTNDVKSLVEGNCCEGFVTNIRGWVVAHVVIGLLPEKILLVGQHRTPHRIVDHIDKYIIREEATVSLLGVESQVLIDGLPSEINTLGSMLAVSEKANSISSFESNGLSGYYLSYGFSGCKAMMLLNEPEAQVSSFLSKSGFSEGQESELELSRIQHGWPVDEIEITEKTLPQELDRDAFAISFTKGCYLGQETIARLDARGQLQKKLCVLQVTSESEMIPATGAQMHHSEKVVGEISSVVGGVEGTFALSTLRRGAFSPGTQLIIKDGDSTQFHAMVIRARTS